MLTGLKKVIPRGNKKLITGLTLPLLLASGVASADYNSAYSAYGSGDYKAAFKEMLPVAEQGNVDAQFWIADMYDFGKGVPENDKAAVKWYTLSAEQGHVSAQYNLGNMYDFGEGVLTDTKRAYMWYNLASYNGNELGAKNKDIIAKEMTPADISKAQDMSSRCLESNYTDC
ncbi:sel1 repeat family protein [Oceanospirillaceae bacterium]|nr:sel1 repeat family protein [Oceanospirillaceae bacterium]